MLPRRASTITFLLFALAVGVAANDCSNVDCGSWTCADSCPDFANAPCYDVSAHKCKSKCLAPGKTMMEAECLGEKADTCKEQSFSAGSCYNSSTHVVTCNVPQAQCTGTGVYWYATGYISGSSGCCHCDAGCNHTEETGSSCSYNYKYAEPEMYHPSCLTTSCKEVADYNTLKSGSCYDSQNGHTVTCNVPEADCNSTGLYWYTAGYVSGSSGCCHCEAGCDHSQETATSCTYNNKYKRPSTGFSTACLDGGCTAPLQAGSCYNFVSHQVTCNVAASECSGDLGTYSYATSHVGGSGCCHCKAGCNSTLETGTSCSYKYSYANSWTCLLPVGQTNSGDGGNTACPADTPTNTFCGSWIHTPSCIATYGNCKPCYDPVVHECKANPTEAMVTMTIEMPYTTEQFTDTKQTAAKLAVAKAMGDIDVSMVSMTMTSLTSLCEGGEASVQLEFEMRGTDSQVSAMQAAFTLDKLNVELAAQGTTNPPAILPI